MKITRTSLILSSTALILGATACQKGAPADPFAIDVVQRAVSIEMKGADAARFTGDSELRIQIPKKGAPMNLVVVSTPGYLDVGNGLSLSIGIALVEQYKGDGTYTIIPTAKTGSGDASPSMSRVSFYAMDTSSDEVQLNTYDRVTVPCEIELREAATVGTVTCPRVVAIEGAESSFRMSWGQP